MSDTPPVTQHTLWEKIVSCATAAGREAIECAITLWYAMLDPEVPVATKGIIVGALAYFILPIDAIPDILPFVGYGDDLAVLMAAMRAAAASITEEHRAKARQQMREWGIA